MAEAVLDGYAGCRTIVGARRLGLSATVSVSVGEEERSARTRSLVHDVRSGFAHKKRLDYVSSHQYSLAAAVAELFDVAMLLLLAEHLEVPATRTSDAGVQVAGDDVAVGRILWGPSFVRLNSGLNQTRCDRPRNVELRVWYEENLTRYCRCVFLEFSTFSNVSTE